MAKTIMAPRPRVKRQKPKTIIAEMRMTNHHKTIEHSQFMDEKGRPRHRVEHRTTTTYESAPHSKSFPAWQAGY